MKINQFSITPTSPAQRQRELARIRLLKKDEPANSTPVDLLKLLLVRTHRACVAPLTAAEWLHSLLATPDRALDDWLADNQPLTSAIFYRIALQLLEFEPGVDFKLTDPQAAWHKLHLPSEEHDRWTATDVANAYYLLLNTRNKNGQIFIDQLTAEGFLAWSESLPAESKPLFFNGKPLASFDPAKFIRDVVYIETDMDTDFDGQADLVKAEIIRPVESNHGLKVPAVFTASPYNQGTNDEWGERATHNVNHSLTHKTADQSVPAEPTFPTQFSHRPVKGHVQQASQHFSDTPAYTLNNYLAVRGYAIVYAAGIGTRDSDGVQTCGSPEQTDSMKAVVEWLHGDRRAFTDRTSNITISADWCNGSVAMTGRSYLGTLATAVATTGVPGLKAIISEAAISSWYDYYRENGLVRAAGGFQGEDADTLADETFSRTKRPADFARIKPVYDKYIDQLTRAMDRASGNYNRFWDRRNYRKDFKGIRAAVMMVHGLNDTNVKPSNVKALYDALQTLPVTSKLILHQGQHIYINAFRSLDFSEMINLWLADKLWGVANQADRVLPKVLVQDNSQPETWTAYDHWTAGQPLTFHLDEHNLIDGDVHLAKEVTFNDHQDPTTYQDWCKHPAKWHAALMADQGRFSRHFVSQPVDQDLLLRGTPQVSLGVACSSDHGLISAELVDLGTARRLTPSPAIINRGGLRLGYHWEKDDLREFRLAKKVSDYKVIARGHINLQNRHDPATVDPLTANEIVNVSFALQPLFHRLTTGHRLGLIIYATDYAFTLRGNENIKYQISLENAILTVPGVNHLN